MIEGIDITSVRTIFKDIEKDDTDSVNLDNAIELLNRKMLHNRGLSQQPQQSKPHSAQQSAAESPPPPPPPPRRPPPPYPLIRIDTIEDPLDENRKNISFHQNVGHFDTRGSIDNHVKELTRVNFEDDRTKNYYVITQMSWNSNEEIPRNLYEKIEDPNIVKSVGSYKGVVSEISGLILNK